MKVIFLDIDGVLNTSETFNEQSKNYIKLYLAPVGDIILLKKMISFYQKHKKA